MSLSAMPVRHVVVSPANSSGFMDGGIDAAYTAFFGRDAVLRVRDAIALVVETGHATVPFLVVAPTMLGPERVPASHAYRALRAALRLADTDPRLHGDWYCPGMTTGIGGVDPDEAASEMAAAYGDWRASTMARDP